MSSFKDRGEGYEVKITTAILHAWYQLFTVWSRYSQWSAMTGKSSELIFHSTACTVNPYKRYIYAVHRFKSFALLLIHLLIRFTAAVTDKYIQEVSLKRSMFEGHAVIRDCTSDRNTYLLTDVFSKIN